MHKEQGRPSLISEAPECWTLGNEERAKEIEKEEPLNTQNISSHLGSLQANMASDLSGV